MNCLKWKSSSILILLILWLASFVNAQSNSVWHFGNSGMLDFRTGGLPSGNCGPGIFTAEGSSVFTLEDGTELFYTDGSVVKYPSGVTIVSGLLGNGTNTSSAIVVPAPDVDISNQYYVFSVAGNNEAAGSDYGVHYTIFDFTDPTNATVVGVINNPLVVGSSLGGNVMTEKIAVVPNMNKDGYWIIVPAAVNGTNTGQLHSYELTTTLSLTPIISDINAGIDAQGWLKANLKGDRLALANPGLVLLNFDRTTGVASFNEELVAKDRNWLDYGAEFSPNGKVLYYSSLAASAEVLAFDLTQNDVSSTLKVVSSSVGTEVGALQLGPDGKIYIAPGINWSSHLHVINTPDDFDNPGFVHAGQSLGCAAAFRGLPTFVSALTIELKCEAPSKADISVTQSEVCEGESVKLTANVEDGYQYTWYEKGDLDSPIQGPSNDLNEITVSSSGDYLVMIADPIDLSDVTCQLTSSEVRVDVYNNPDISDDTIKGLDLVCEGALSETYEFESKSAKLYTNYNWSSPTNGAVNSNPTEVITAVDFSGSDASLDVLLSMTVGEQNGAIVCTSDALTKTVSIQMKSEVVLDTDNITTACNTSEERVDNVFEITDYDFNTSYTFSVDPVGKGVVHFDETTGKGWIETLEETFVISVLPEINGCEGMTSFITVAVAGCGIEAIITSIDAECQDGTITLRSTSDPGINDAEIVSYIWSVPAGLEIVSGAGTSEIVVMVTSGSDIPQVYDVTLEIENNFGVTDLSEIKTITFNPIPTAASIRVVDDARCKGDTVEFFADPYDASSAYSWAVSGEDKYYESPNKDSLHVINDLSSYTVTLSTSNSQGCMSSDSYTQAIDGIPSATGIFGDTSTCIFISTDNSYQYHVEVFNSDTIRWSVSPSFAEEVIIGSDYNDTVQLNMPNFSNSTIDLSVWVGSKSCKYDTTITQTIYIDTTYKLIYDLLGEEYCEGDSTTFVINPFVEKGTDQDTIWAKYTWFTNDSTIVRDENDLLISDTLIWDPIQFNDVLVIQAEPEVCFSANSKLRDTLILDVRQRPNLELALNGDTVIHILKDIVNVSNVVITDEANIFTSNLYTVVWVSMLGDTLGATIEPFVLNTIKEIPAGYDSLMYLGVLIDEDNVCVLVDTVLLVIELDIFIPTAFTPNGDGVHDTWHIDNMEDYPDVKVSVYNRWGSLLYEVIDYANNEWNGEYEGETLPVASYYYVIDLGDGVDPKSGAVSIFK
jgi:gliding motility-associated-like protein